MEEGEEWGQEPPENCWGCVPAEMTWSQERPQGRPVSILVATEAKSSMDMGLGGLVMPRGHGVQTHLSQ